MSKINLIKISTDFLLVLGAWIWQEQTQDIGKIYVFLFVLLLSYRWFWGQRDESREKKEKCKKTRTLEWRSKQGRKSKNKDVFFCFISSSSLCLPLHLLLVSISVQCLSFLLFLQENKQETLNLLQRCTISLNISSSYTFMKGNTGRQNREIVISWF